MNVKKEGSEIYLVLPSGCKGYFKGKFWKEKSLATCWCTNYPFCRNEFHPNIPRLAIFQKKNWVLRVFKIISGFETHLIYFVKSCPQCENHEHKKYRPFHFPIPLCLFISPKKNTMKCFKLFSAEINFDHRNLMLYFLMSFSGALTDIPTAIFCSGKNSSNHRMNLKMISGRTKIFLSKTNITLHSFIKLPWHCKYQTNYLDSSFFSFLTWFL